MCVFGDVGEKEEAMAWHQLVVREVFFFGDVDPLLFLLLTH